MKYNYDTEKKFLDKVEKCLQKSGCQIWREVIPDICKDWTQPYRVDLILYRADLGYIGVEGKNINTLRGAKKISTAIDQINIKYKNQTYFKGNLISKWCIAAPFDVDWISKEALNLTKTFLNNLLNVRYKISLMEYIDEDKKLGHTESVCIDSYTKKSLTIGEKNDD